MRKKKLKGGYRKEIYQKGVRKPTKTRKALKTLGTKRKMEKTLRGIK